LILNQRGNQTQTVETPRQWPMQRAGRSLVGAQWCTTKSDPTCWVMAKVSKFGNTLATKQQSTPVIARAAQDDVDRNMLPGKAVALALA
jgi:hypothetical protein